MSYKLDHIVPESVDIDELDHRIRWQALMFGAVYFRFDAPKGRWMWSPIGLTFVWLRAPPNPIVTAAHRVTDPGAS